MRDCDRELWYGRGRKRALGALLALAALAVGQSPVRASDQAVERLLDAVTKDDEQGVRNAIRLGVRPDSYPPASCTAPILRAAELGRAAILQILLEWGNPNGRGVSCPTPLHFAAAFGHLEAVRALVAAKANVNIRSPLDFGAKREIRNGDTPLVCAVRGRPA
jgi:ankyrin repeat protein